MLRLNGKVVEGLAPFDLGDRGLTLGDGLFETIAVFGGKPALLDAHYRRLKAAAAEIRLPLDRVVFLDEINALLDDIGNSDAVIRFTLTRGAGARGLALPQDATPNVIASSSSYPSGVLNAPIRLATVSVRRNPTSLASRAKTLSYLDSVLALDEAKRAGAGDALMLNTEGRVASTSMANLFALFGDELVTPPGSEGVLPGIVRAVVLQTAAEAELRPVERPLEVSELADADAVFATNSVRLIMPVTAIDGKELGRRAAVDWIATLITQACGAAIRWSSGSR